QLILQATPNPAADVLQCRYLQPIDVVEVGVVQDGPQLDDLFVYLTEIIEPVLAPVGLAPEVDLDPEGVAVQLRVRVADSHVDRQVMRSLEGEFFENLVHNRSLCPNRALTRRR